MSKRIFSIILAVCMLIGMISVTAFAEVPEYEYSKIAYFNGGKQVSSITAGETTAKVKVKSESATDTLLFAAFLYKDDVLEEVALDETPEAVSSIAVTYEATVTVPSDVTGVKIVSLLWKNAKDMEPVCSSSIFPSSNVKLKSLSVEGEPIPDFSPDVYEYTIPADPSLVYAPYIRYAAVDNGADVKINDAVEFPGKSTVVVTSSDGSTSLTYTINYSWSDPLAKVISCEAANHIGYVNFGYNLQEGVQLFPYRKQIPLVWVSEKIAGSEYITSSFGSDFKNYTFAIRRGAKISTYGQGSHEAGNSQFYSEADGWTLDDKGWDTSEISNWANDEICSCETHTAEHEEYGACYCILYEDGSCTGTSRIGNGLDELPEEGYATEQGQLAYENSKYDNRNQGWFCFDYRTIQLNRPLSFSAFTLRYTKHFPASTFDESDNATAGTITITRRNELGQAVTFEWDDYLPNDYLGFEE